MLDAIDALDLQRARLLARLSDFWNQQAQCACSFQTILLLSPPTFSPSNAQKHPQIGPAAPARPPVRLFSRPCALSAP